MRGAFSTRDRNKVAIRQRECNLRQGENRSHPCQRRNPAGSWQIRGKVACPSDPMFSNRPYRDAHPEASLASCLLASQ